MGVGVDVKSPYSCRLQYLSMKRSGASNEIEALYGCASLITRLCSKSCSANENKSNQLLRKFFLRR